MRAGWMTGYSIPNIFLSLSASAFSFFGFDAFSFCKFCIFHLTDGYSLKEEYWVLSQSTACSSKPIRNRLSSSVITELTSLTSFSLVASKCLAHAGELPFHSLMLVYKIWSERLMYGTVTSKQAEYQPLFYVC